MSLKNKTGKKYFIAAMPVKNCEKKNMLEHKVSCDKPEIIYLRRSHSVVMQNAITSRVSST